MTLQVLLCSRSTTTALDTSTGGDEVTDAIRGAVRTGDDLASPVSKLDDFTDACRANSFLGKTRVKMADGSRKRISKIKVGDKVLATDPSTGKTLVKRVVDVIIGLGPKQLVDVKIDGEVINCYDGHPFFVRGEGWIDAEDLETDDR